MLAEFLHPRIKLNDMINKIIRPFYTSIKAVKKRQLIALKPIIYGLIFLFMTLTSCNSRNQTNVPGDVGKFDTINTDESMKTEVIITEKHYTDWDVLNAAMLDSKGNIWFGSSLDGVYRYDGNTFTNFSLENDFSQNRTSAILEDKNGNILFGADGGFWTYDGKTFTHTQIPPDAMPVPEDDPIGLYPRNMVLSLLEDQSGLLWIGSTGAGVYSYDGEKFTNYLAEEGRIQSGVGLHRNVIQSMVEDDDGNIWFTSMTHGGINSYDGESFTHYSIEDGLPDDMIFSSFKDSKGGLWFGTLDVGLIHFDGESFTYLDEDDGVTNNMISCIREDKDGALWLGSFRGTTVCLYDGETFTPFEADKNDELDEIKFITEDKDGNVWFGGRDGKLWQYDGKKLIDFTQKKNN
ncbi:MAG: ligand-binding sensor domain-containing protein [Crocinitomix sp.]|jgi:ligand-binding sensor domain-containing protein